MIYTVKTSLTKEEVVEKIYKVSKLHGFGVLGKYEFKEILKKKGFPIEKEIIVFELCNPKAAQKALKYKASVSVYLPCRVSVYEENKDIFISTINIEDILFTFESDDEFKKYMIKIFANLKKLIDSLVY